MSIPVRSTLLLDEIASPLGRIVIAARDGRLCALEFGRERMARHLAARYPASARRRSRSTIAVEAMPRRLSSVQSRFISVRMKWLRASLNSS